MQEARADFETKSKVLRDKLEMERKAEILQLEKHKTAHTARVTRDHEKALHEIRDYFVDVTGNILEKLKDLKATVSRVDHVRLYLAKGSLPPGHMEAGGGAVET